MLGRKREVRPTEILSTPQVQQVQQDQVQQCKNSKCSKYIKVRCSIFVKNNKCSKGHEIEGSKDNKTKCDKNTHRTVGRSKQVPNRLVPRGYWVFCARVLAAETAAFCGENGSFSARKLAWA